MQPLTIKTDDLLQEILEGFFNEKDKFFDNPFRHLMSSYSGSIEKIFPSYPVTNEYFLNDGTYGIDIAVTGWNKNDIDINIENNVLKIKAIKNQEKSKNEKKYIHHGIAQRDFHIQYKLSDKLDIDKANVKMENGVLKIEIPCKKEYEPVTKTLQIK